MQPEERFDRLVEEPPSAKLVYKVLEIDAPRTHGEITEAAVLPARTTSYALSRLQDAGVIEAMPCPSDPRKQHYHPLPITDPALESGNPEADTTTPHATRATAPGQASD